MAESEYTMRETAAYYAQRIENITDAARANGWKLTLRDVVGLDCARAFLVRVARDDLDVFAPEPNERYPGESEPVATNPVLRGVDLAMDRLVQRDCFTERTLRILDELRAEVLATEPTDLSEACGDGEHACCGFPTCPCTCHEPTEQEQNR